MKKFDRTVGCGLVDKSLVGKEITLCGWVDKWRDHGGLIFIDLRDRSGVMQLVFDPKYSKKAHKESDLLRSEYVISVRGKVAKRSKENINADKPTGELDLQVEDLKILNKS